jgi:hypothetical protein
MGQKDLSQGFEAGFYTVGDVNESQTRLVRNLHVTMGVYNGGTGFQFCMMPVRNPVICDCI